MNEQAKEITQDQLDELVEDASYLQDEAEALQYVIDTIPYDDSPPDGSSIAEMLLLIDHAQLSYYRPILENTVQNPRPTHIDKFDHFRDTFEADPEDVEDIHNTLKKIAKHRAGLVNVINNISLIDWETIIYRNGQELLLFDFIQEMIQFERSKLKQIADQVMVFKQEREARRDIEKRAERRNEASDNR